MLRGLKIEHRLAPGEDEDMPGQLAQADTSLAPMELL